MSVCCLYWKKEYVCLLSVLEEGICPFAFCSGKLEEGMCLLSVLKKKLCPFAVCTGERNVSIYCLYQEGNVSSTRTGMCLFTVYTRQGMCQFGLESECVCLLPVLEKEFVCLLWKGNVSFAVHNGRHCTLQLLSEKGMWLFAVSTKEYICCQLSMERKCGCLWEGNVDFLSVVSGKRKCVSLLCE